MDVNAPTPSNEVKSEGFSSKTKRTYVIGVVDTTGMKSANANRKRRWDQPPNEEGDSVPPKVIVREAEGDSTQLDPKLLGVVAEGMQDSIEDYDSQYEECVGSNKVVPDSSVDEPALEDVQTAPVSGFDIPISKGANESVVDSRFECPEKLSLVDDVKPDNTPPLPGIECLPSPPKEIEGSDHFKVSTATVKDKVNEEPKKDVKSDGKIEEKVVTKPVEAIPVTGILSDSLKQIQFCYDEDSNSTDESEVETRIVVGDKTDVEMVAKKEDNIIDEQLSEQIAPTDATVNPSGIEATKDTRRSPTPVLSEEQDENLVSETVVTQKESIAIFECKTDNDGVIASHSVTDTNEEIHYKPVNTNVESVSEKGSCSAELTELNSENSVGDAGEADSQAKVASTLSEQGITSEPLDDSAIVPEAQYQEHQPKDKLSHSDRKTPPLVHASDKALPEIKQGFVSPALLTADVGQLKANVLCNEVSLKPSESQQPNNEAISQGDPSGRINAVKETKITCKSSNAKPANDPTERNSETSLSKDMKILMEDSSEKYASVNDHKMPGKNTGRTNLVSMDNSQNCVGFDDLNSLEKVIPKSPELDLRYSDSEEDVKFSSSEITMHFASFRTPENATNTKPERDIEDAKEESAKALDALIAENPERDIEDKEESAKALDALIAENPEMDIEDAKEESAKALDALIAENPEMDIEDAKEESAKALDALIAENPEMDIEDAKEESAKALDALIAENPERDIEDKEESAKALGAVIAENPDLGDKEVQFQEPASSIDGNTMEMLDSLVRRSSEDDPSRVQLGEGMLSEDSLINEINQLPDDSLTNEINQLPDKGDDDKKIGPDKNLEDSSVPVVKSTSPDSKGELKSPSKDGVEAEAVHDEPKKSAVAINPDISENVSTDLSYSKEIVDTPGEIKSKPGDHRNVDKSEGGTSVEDELSQGGEEEPKNMNVSSENIIEVIFGSKQENSIHTIRSMERDGDSKVTEKSDGDVMSTEDSLAVDVQPKTSSYSNSAQKSVDDSKLQLNNEEIEIDNTEIVMVDPTKPLSGEDSDNDAEEGPSNKDALTNKEAEVSLTPPPEVIVAPVDDGPVPQSNPSSELVTQSIPNSKTVEEEGSLMEVEESNSLDTLIIETATIEPMDVDKKTELPPVVSVDNSAEMKTKKQEKATPVNEGSHTREPSVPVLIIKKQALPSKKDGDKKVVETLLTCSPKSADNLVSDRAPTPPHKKVHNEALQIDTAPESTTASFSPKHSPITLRIYKDNLTVKTDLDSPKRNKSPMSSEFKSELSPKVRSPGVSENLSPQNKQLEFTLKIAKDAHTNYPKATMSPKNVSSPNSVWKSEVQIADSPNVTNKDEQDVKQVKQSVPPRGRGRGRGRGATPKRGSLGRGRRGGFRGRVSSGVDETSKTSLETAEASSSSLGVPDVVIKQEVLTEDEKSDSSSVGAPIQMHDMFKKMINKEAEGSGTPDKSIHSEVLIPHMIDTPIARKRGRPRKSIQTPIVVPEELVIVKQEPITPVETTTPVIDGGDGDDGSSSTGRPKRTCRGRTKPIVVKKRKPRGGGAAGASVPRCDSTPLPPIQIKEENVTTPATASATTEATTPESITLPAVTPSPPVDKPAVAPTPPARGRGGFKRPTPDRNTLSEKELAELQKIEAKKEKLRLDRIAKYEAKKAKKLAKKLKDEERRKRLAREKAEKAEAAAPQVFEEETRMSAPDSSCTGQTPGPHRILTGDGLLDESQNSISTPGDTNKGNKKGRMEISITDMDCLVKEVRVDELAEYQWQGSELFMIQEQISLYLGVKSFKRKYPGLKRRPVEAEERTFLEDSGLVPKSMCDLGLTAVGSAEILDIMFQDFPEKYEEFRKHVRDKQAREASFRQKAAIGLQKKDGTKVEPREQALEAVAAWNANLNRERREERRCALDLQTFTVHYPKLDRENMKKHVPKVGLYPVAVIPGQFCDHYKKYTPNELMYFPVNTVLYGPLRPNERQKDNGSDDGSGSESSSSSSSSSSSGESSSESESEGEEPAKCKMCSGTKKKNKDGIAEVLLTCVQCKSCYHPTCKEFTSEMIVHLTKYEWQCTACKRCSKCRDPNLKDRIMCCQLCDRGYHLSCIGLKKMPEGRWHCTVCAYCSSCGSRNPGGSDWQHEFKKGEKGIKIYQRTLCTPCFKLWRKGKYCQLCSKCHSVKPEEDPSLIQCNSCDRWLHKDCYGSKYGLTNKLMSTSSIQCDFCVERITLGSHGMNRSLIKV